MVSIQIKMWACFGIIWSFKWEHFWQIMLIQIQMWAYSGKIWYPNMIIFWQKVHSNSNVSIIWQSITNPNVSLFWQNMRYKCEHILAKSRFQSQCEHYLAKSKKEHFERFNELFNFLPKSTFWTKIGLLIKVWFRSTASFTTAKRGRKECRLRYRRLLQQLLEKASWIPLKSAVFSLVHKVRLSRILGLSFPSFGAVSEKKFRIFSVAQTDKS